MKSYNGKTLCLNMIVKNEAHIIQETLDNISHLIDYWVICDTGSTDGTQDLIKSYFKRKGIPGELKQHEWEDFGTNRTKALQECRGKADYIFVIDADDLIVGDFQLPKRMTADSYQLIYGQGFTYHRTQIFGNHLEWKYVGVLHEYPACVNKTKPSEQVIQGKYYMDSRRLGARNQDPDKYKKDAMVLVKGIDKEMENGDKGLAGRYAFYAGQSFIDCGDYENAIKYYQKRVDMGGWFEETYYSYYKIAMAKKFLQKDEKEVEKAFLDAHNFLPSRAEPLYELALYFRGKNNFQKGYSYALKASKIKFPKDQKLFLFKEFYDWKIKDEMGICAFYLEKYEESYKICKQLLNEGFIPEDQRLRIEANRDFCVPFIKDKLIGYNSQMVKKIHRNVKKTKRKMVTYSVTTCKRFDLFEKTINSFINCCQDILQIDRWLCVDDNSSVEDRAKMKKLYPFFDFIWKTPEQKGHPESMNIIIEEVKTPFLLHMEDDWQFFEEKNYVKPALEILKENERLGQVCFNRNYAEVLNDRNIPGGVLKFSQQNNYRYLIHEHYKPDSKEYEHFNRRHNNAPSSCYWPHYSLRPSVLRTQIFKDIGKYNENTSHFEMEYSNRYVEKGYMTAFYDGICSLHIGRLTSERGDQSKKNAYELNEESQFGTREKKDNKRVTWKTDISSDISESSDEKSISRDNSNHSNSVETTITSFEKDDDESSDDGSFEIKEFRHTDEDDLVKIEEIKVKSSKNNMDYDKILESAKKYQDKNIPKGMDTLCVSEKVKNALDDVVTNYNFLPEVQQAAPRRVTSGPISAEESEELMKGKQFEGYIFFPNKDSMGHDIQHIPNKTVEELKEECDKDPKCIGFNTLGYMKHTINDEDDFISLPNYDGKLSGLYVNKKHYDNAIQKVIDKLVGKKYKLAVLIKHDDDYLDFKEQINRLLLHCKDIDQVKRFILLNYNVDCDVQDKILKDFPFFDNVIQKTETDSLKDVLKLLNENQIEYVFSWKDDFCRKSFMLQEGINKLENGKYEYQTEGKGPYICKVEEIDWTDL